METPNISDLNSANCREKSIQNNWPEFFNFLMSNYVGDYKFSERLALYYHNLSTRPVCVVCGNPVKFINFKAGWRRTCCAKCAGIDPLTIEKKKQTCLKKFGVDNAAKSNQSKNKSKQTCLEKYGIDNVSKSNNIINKIKQTNINKYGVEWAMQSELVKSKAKQTNIDKYGVGYSMQCDVVKEKSKQTCLKKYGGIGMASNELSNKTKATLFERYGVDNIFKTEKSIHNQKISTQKRLLINHPNIIEVTKNYIYTCKCPHPNCNLCNEKKYQISNRLYWNRVSHNCEMCTHLNPVDKYNNKNTSIETYVKDILDKNNIIYESNPNSTILNGKHIDIYCPELKKGIECNGVYWHSSIYKKPNYHINKSNQAREKGVQLYHIWEDWIYTKPDIVESMILNWMNKSKYKIFARKCVVQKVQRKEGMEFLNKNHIQGQSNYKVGYGLYYNNELVSLMTFGYMRGCMGKNTNHQSKSDQEWELVRFCSKLNTNVVGGASKLLSHFINEYNPSKIISYASQDISNGDLYKKLGFKSNGIVTPSYWYIHMISMKRYHRSAFTKKSLIKRGLGNSNQTETDIMATQPYYKIFDSGQTKWILEI